MTTFGFASTDQEAGERYLQYRRTDPFPDIPSALLNSADIYDYVRATGMVHPFHLDEGNLKSASYEVPFSGRVISWEDAQKRTDNITIGQQFRLKKNSIAFVWPDTVFRLPDYIAIRFNFRITHVHRGLLLGTGPLVDPGFWGRILIPLHNLTSEDYVLVGGDGLIWVEFTKVSPNKRWNKGSERQETNFQPFPEDKANKEPHYYFEKASGNQPIQSSIPGEVKKAQQDAESARSSSDAAKEYVADFRKIVYGGAIAGAVALFLTLAGIIFANLTLISNTNSRIDSIMKRLGTLEAIPESKPKPDVDAERTPKSKSSVPDASAPKQPSRSQADGTERIAKDKKSD